MGSPKEILGKNLAMSAWLLCLFFSAPFTEMVQSPSLIVEKRAT